MSCPRLQVPYARPKRLSDPCGGFSAGQLKELLDKADGMLQWHDYRNLLGPFLPAGTYQESVYFLPGAFDYILTHDEGALDLTTALTGFVSRFWAELAADRLLEPARDCLRECLRHWTCQFRVTHFDQDACSAKGWGLAYFDYVQHTEVVAQTTCDLVEFGRHADLAEGFTRELAFNERDPTKAAWYLEYARSQHDVYHPPDHGPVKRLLNDKAHLERAAELVRRNVVGREPSPTYWADTFRVLGLRDWSG